MCVCDWVRFLNAAYVLQRLPHAGHDPLTEIHTLASLTSFIGRFVWLLLVLECEVCQLSVLSCSVVTVMCTTTAMQWIALWYDGCGVHVCWSSLLLYILEILLLYLFIVSKTKISSLPTQRGHLLVLKISDRDTNIV